MFISKLQASMAKYEASEMIKKHIRNGDNVQLQSFSGIARDSTQLNNQGKILEILKDNKNVGLKLSSNAHPKTSKLQFSREQMKEIFRYHDNDKDGFLNLRELTKAFAFLGSIIPFEKASYGMSYADANKDGLISEAELDKLIDYAQKFVKKK
ncbi:calmodulin-like protein 1 [Cucurbita pepo subsp. pepo]|uniref:calmodulin-like protein 1 n=1 Tax=Cucurbita pepo subsp. pepo TaxID=3664 RepID=UPI000C9D2AFD|nr:calmodulin-like protein 1 [Cucurbita pepo subsp. pepo]